MTSTFYSNKRLVNIKGVTAHKNKKKKTKADFQETFEKVNPDIIVNCVGYTDVDGCESDPNKSYNSNVGFASLVAKEASKQGKKFVHISTDHLFDGTKPFSSEQCLPNPLNVYAQHKLEAEDAILKVCADALICRTNFICWGPSHRASFADLLFHQLNNGKVASAFDDVFFTPISVSQLATLLFDLIRIDEKGIFNLCNNERISKYEFSKKTSSSI